MPTIWQVKQLRQRRAMNRLGDGGKVDGPREVGLHGVSKFRSVPRAGKDEQ